MSDVTRWTREDVPRGDAYDRRFQQLEAAGADVHGEAAFVASFTPSSVLDAGCGTGRVAIELARRGIALEAWSPLGQAQDLQDRAIGAIAADLGRTAAQVIIRWHLQKGNIVIPKSVTPSRIAENADVFSFELSPDQMASIDGLDSGNRIGPDPATATF